MSHITPRQIAELISADRRGTGLREKLQVLIRHPYGISLAGMIADAGFAKNRFNDDINARNFPLDKEGPYDASGLSLFGGNREYSINRVKTKVEAEGGRLEGLVRGLRYLNENPGALKDGTIVFPASSWVDGGHVAVPCADLDGGEPWLGLRWGGPRSPWHRHARFLVSRKSST